MTTPAIVRGETRHKRRFPFVHALTVPNYLWLFESAKPPKLILGRWLAKDHFGGTASSIDEAIRHFAKTHEASLEPTDRLLTLTAPRSLGHVFNPLSVHYCVTPDGTIRWAILEVHNTYGERHAYLLNPSSDGSAQTEKQFYVSPFFEVRGNYDVKLQLSDERIVVVVNLHQDDTLVFSASFTGIPFANTVAQRLQTSLRFPFASYQTSTRIKMHGIWLWLRRLPVVKRTPHMEQKGML